MKLIEVNSKESIKEFIKLPIRLYKNEKAWIRPLDKDIEAAVFDPKVNKFFRHGSLCRWILKNDENITIGRVAAFINKKTLNKGDVKTGGMGFFECIEDKGAAFMLFDKCKEWLQNQDVEAMDGPINFGERDKWWGLLVQGFVEQNYCMPYNFPYYQTLFEEYGFQLYFKQFTYKRMLDHPIKDTWIEKAKRIARNKDYSFGHLSKKELGKYSEYFRIVYNQAWAGHSGTSEMSSAQAAAVINQLKPIMVEDLIWFAYYKGEPVGFFIMFPELNQTFKYLNGKLDLLGKIKFVLYKFLKPTKKVFGVAFGIVPKHQAIGLEGALVNEVASWIIPSGRYDNLEMNWIGDFNPKMLHICESLGASIAKTHYTYRYLFDRSKKFERAPKMD